MTAEPDARQNRVYIHPNYAQPEVCMFHVNWPLTDSSSVHKYAHGDEKPEGAKKGWRLCEGVLGIPGVLRTHISMYELHVYIGQAFVEEWEEIRRQVIKHLEARGGIRPTVFQRQSDAVINRQPPPITWVRTDEYQQ